MQKRGPHIILINVDQWRGDCLGASGHPVVSTPYLDAMAAGGVSFARAYTAVPTCIGSRAALHTGLDRRRHGRVGYQDGIPWTYPVTMAGEFRRHGYQTQAVGKMHVYPERATIGFDHVALHDGYLHGARRSHKDQERADDYLAWLRRELGSQFDITDHGLDCNSWVARPWDKPEHTHPTTWATSEAIGFLKRRDPTRPFFLYLSYHRPHPPYDPPAWAFESYMDTPMPAPPQGDWTDFYAPWEDARVPSGFVGQVSEWTLRRARAGYWGHMSHIDHQIQRLQGALYEEGLSDQCWILFVSDHGEMMGDHGLFRKGYPYEGSARVPLILKGPAGSGLKAGTLEKESLVELRDVLPTLLDCAGLPIPKGVDGKSVLPLAQGKKVSWRKTLGGEHTLLGQAIHWVFRGTLKYAWFSAKGYEQLFDLKQDPQEERNLAGEPSMRTMLKSFRDLLAKELSGREEGYVKNGRLVPGRKERPILLSSAAFKDN